MSERSLISRAPGKTIYHERDNSDPDGHYRIMEQLDDDTALLEDNKKRRLSGLLKKGDRAPLKIDKTGKNILRMWLRIPSQFLYDKFLAENPRIQELLLSSNPDDQIRGAELMALSHPEWLVSA